MINQDSIEKIRAHIVQGDLGTAFNLIIKLLDKNSEHFDNLISLKRQYSLLTEDRNLNKLSEDSFRIELNRVTANLLSIIREIEVSQSGNTDELDFIDEKNYEKVILDLISKGDLDGAFLLLKRWLDSENLPEDYMNDFLVLYSRFNSVKNDERKGILAIDTIRIEYSKISKSLILLLKEIRNVPKLRIQQKAKQEQIEITAASFVQESISELNKRENRLKFQAGLWYIIGFASLIGGISIAAFLVKTNQNELTSTIGIVYLILKSLLIIGLLVAASRYAFNLGKTYMNESLKNADRIHAISFGKFYLQVFGTNIKPEDLKDVFKDWNTNQESAFIKLDSSEFDPQLLQAFLKFAEVMKVGGK